MKKHTALSRWILPLAFALSACSVGDVSDESALEHEAADDLVAADGEELAPEDQAPIESLDQALSVQPGTTPCALFCAPGTHLDPSGACRCVPDGAPQSRCSVMLCVQGTHCVEGPFNASCVPNTPGLP